MEVYKCIGMVALVSQTWNTSQLSELQIETKWKETLWIQIDSIAWRTIDWSGAVYRPVIARIRRDDLSLE